MATILATLTVAMVIGLLGYIVAEWINTGSTLICYTADEGASSLWAEELLASLEGESVGERHRRRFSQLCSELKVERAARQATLSAKRAAYWAWFHENRARETVQSLEVADTEFFQESVSDEEIEQLVSSLTEEILAPPTLKSASLELTLDAFDLEIFDDSQETRPDH